MELDVIKPIKRQNKRQNKHQKDFSRSVGSVGETSWEEPEPQRTYSPSRASVSSPSIPRPTKSSRKTFPIIRDHTVDRLGPEEDEYLPKKIDDAGEKKVTPNGALRGGREYRCRTFLVPKRGDKLFMLATECARVLGYRDLHLLFSKNQSLYKTIVSQTEKEELVSQDILPFTSMSPQIPIVTARSIFRQFGSRVIVNGRRVRDDYWEAKARKQGFTEDDLAGEKRPGASKARQVVAAAAERNSSSLDRDEGDLDLVDIAPFRLYRRHRKVALVSKYPHLSKSHISKIIGELWIGENEEVWGHWKRLADEEQARSRPHPEPRRAGFTGLAFLRPDNARPPNIEILITPPSSDPISDIQRNVAHASRSGSFDSRAAAALPEVQDHTQLEPQRPVLESKLGVDPFDMPGKGASPQSTMQDVFADVLAQWSSAEHTEARLHLLKRLDKQRPEILPEVACVGSAWQGWLRCEWELPRVVRQLRGSQPGEIQTLLESFVTITGSRGDMECSTCAQFLENEWKESGEMALEVLCQGMLLLEHRQGGSTTSSVSTPNQNVKIHHVSDTHITIELGENPRDTQSFVDAIVWICTAVRVANPERQTSDSGKRSQLQFSKATQLSYIDSVQPQVLVYGLEQFTECSDQDVGPQASCWTRLFSWGIVAFHSLERQWGAGLEISFDMMVHLSGVENAYQIDGGIIFVGFFTALIPISRDATTNSVQWHFEEVDASSGEILKPYSLPSVRGDWYRSQDINLLRTSKCFVGWFARANILLGTRQLVVNSRNRLNWSTETKEHHQSARREGFEASGQLGFTAGPINTGLQLISTWRFHSNVQHFHRHEQYNTALRLSRGNVAIIIDSETKQVWLVPMLSVVLHLCHRYFQELDQSGRTSNPLPFAEPSPDGASEAARVLESSGDVPVFGATGDPESENLRQLFLRINTNLLNAAGTREPSNKKTLFASELMAMVTEPGRGSPLKKMKAPADAESWVGLLERVDFVGVCANIGQLIEPENQSTNTCTCSALPNDRYLLAAHMRCLDVLSKREGNSILKSLNMVCRLGERVFWNVDKVYWTSCPAEGHDSIWNEKNEILQQISSKERGKRNDVSGVNGTTAVAQRFLPEDGVVVFGVSVIESSSKFRNFPVFARQFTWTRTT